MHRRYTIHRDGDLLVEELDAQGKPLHPEAVAPEDRLGVELIVKGADDVDGRTQLLDLLEMALEIETHGADESVPLTTLKPKP